MCSGDAHLAHAVWLFCLTYLKLGCKVKTKAYDLGSNGANENFTLFSNRCRSHKTVVNLQIGMLARSRQQTNCISQICSWTLQTAIKM